MSGRLPGVSVIIRTRADLSRHASMERAVRSIAVQDGVRAKCIMVLNGAASASPATLPSFDTDVTRVYAPYADKAAATAIGRAAVETEYFSYLDDDDELLPGALALRVSLLQRTGADCVATNGIAVTKDGIKPALAVRHATKIDYADEILKGRNWLASCGATFRSETVTGGYFEDLPPHCEWTVVGFRVADRLRMHFDDTPTYRIYSSPQSQSKLPSYIETLPEIVDDMFRWNSKPRRIPALLRRRAVANHVACSYHRINGNFSRAWHYYWRSVRNLFGIQYVPYATLLLARSRSPVTALRPAEDAR